MRYFLILYLSILNSCGFLQTTNNRELEIIVEVFENRWGKKVTVPIKFSPVRFPARVAAMCTGFRAPRFMRLILIDEYYWEQIDYWRKEMIVFHELGHCELDLDHDNGITTEKFYSRPLSIMYEDVIPDYFFYREEYIAELFTRKSTL